ncbi:putative naringenin-chalcone synthase [Williamsia limnetica]|jgi:predicted naringenin-chalcone synthase|uniref:Putative naringenin-chalcone synthase n=1 Tax=Williamsia limnetica TaxID=882452 RepID=A0A318S4Y3_WILLI|nr:type III polyketide synthase [Williamsia limnetica]PYE19209.1 putative naringenin-chalcone synthase [Williamsia limnetica]
MVTAYVNQISTAVPELDVHETFVEFAPQLIDARGKMLLFKRMAERAHISHRWSAVEDPVTFYGDNPSDIDTETRMIEYEDKAPKLAQRAVDGLDLGASAGDITHLVIVTCTGFYSPGIDYDIIENCGISPNVDRTQIGFMGCFAGITGLKTANNIVRADPSAKVLLVSVELCSVHLQKPKSLESMLSFLIFGDGCAAVVISAETTGIALDSFKQVMVPDTRDLITWRIGNAGYDMVLSGKVPGQLGRALNPENLKLILAGRTPDDIDLWAIHPGGRTILDAVENALELDSDALAVSRHVLDNYGNMSSATVLFVLAEMMKRAAAGGPTGLGSAMAFGPGLTAETMLFRLE